MKSSPAPALTRGIQIFKILSSGGEHSLQGLARATGLPKASLLRMLAALVGCGVVVRGENGLYRPLARLTPMADDELSFRVQPVLNALAEAVGQTTEWYVPSPEGLVLTRRAEPTDMQVVLRANIGFIRHWVGELEAVCLVGRAFYHDVPVGKFWRYVRDGQVGKISAAAANRLVAAAANGVVFDKILNSNGVRRAACSILRDGKLIGILAVAEYRKPGPDRTNEIVRQLRIAASKLKNATIES